MLLMALQALHEDIELRRQNVDQAMQNGLELLKQTTGEISHLLSFEVLGLCVCVHVYIYEVVSCKSL